MLLATILLVCILLLRSPLLAAEREANNNPIKLPKFVISNVDVEPDQDGYVEFDARTKGGKNESHIFYDIERVGNKYRAKLLGKGQLQSKIDGWKSYVPGLHEEALLCVHGFNVPPKDWLESCAKYRDIYKRWVIPVIWVCEDRGLFGYDADRIVNAPGASEAFRRLLHTATPFHKSIMCASMGNYVLKLAAKSGERKPFRNIFMVAADIRRDVFDEAQNRHNEPTKNDGLEIAGLAKRKVHVMHSSKDLAMLGRRFSRNNKFRSALGARGFRPSRLHEDLHGKVINVNCNDRNTGDALSKIPWYDHIVNHGYHFKLRVIGYYETVMKTGEDPAGQ